MMRKLNLLVPGFFMLVMAATCAAQQTNARDNETGPIRAVAEMYTSGEPAKLRMAFHPEAKLFAVRDGELLIITLSQYLENVSKGAPSAAQRPQRTVDRIERAGNIATATITTVSPGIKIVDFLTLVEISGQWKIINKTFYVEKTSAAGVAPAGNAESQPGDREIQEEKKYFDFLFGKWVIEKSETPSGTTNSAKFSMATPSPPSGTSTEALKISRTTLTRCISARSISQPKPGLSTTLVRSQHSIGKAGRRMVAGFSIKSSQLTVNGFCKNRNGSSRISQHYSERLRTPKTEVRPGLRISSH